MDKLENYFVDLDGTLAESIYPRKGIGKPLDGNIDKLIEVYKKGFKIFIYTSRPWAHYEAIKKWCEANLPEIELEGIVCGKPLGQIVDDRNIDPDEFSWT